jgi:hypothetical protein
MAELIWDAVGDRKYETGVDQGVLYIPNGSGVYNMGVAWNGLVGVSEAPSGAEANPQYADNQKYLNLFSAEEFGATIEAFTYPNEFAQFDGLGTPVDGVYVGQQSRGSFGLSYRTKIGNDVEGDDFGYKLHLVYGCSASPSEKGYTTINDSPEAITLSWEVTTIPVAVTGMKNTAILTIDSTEVDAVKLAALEVILYGADGVDPRLPLPDEVIELFQSGVTMVTVVAPTINTATNVITIPSVTGVVYYIDGVALTAGAQDPITDDVLVTAGPATSPSTVYVFNTPADTEWLLEFTP